MENPKRAKQATLFNCALRLLPASERSLINDRAGMTPVMLDPQVIEARRKRLVLDEVVAAGQAAQARLALSPHPGIRPVGRPLGIGRIPVKERLQCLLAPTSG